MTTHLIHLSTGELQKKKDISQPFITKFIKVKTQSFLLKLSSIHISVVTGNQKLNNVLASLYYWTLTLRFACWWLFKHFFIWMSGNKLSPQCSDKLDDPRLCHSWVLSRDEGPDVLTKQLICSETSVILFRVFHLYEWDSKVSAQLNWVLQVL